MTQENKELKEIVKLSVFGKPNFKDTPVIIFEDTEYICKEPLLKWLDTKCHEVIPHERQRAFEEVIDKIKAMSHE